MNLLYGLVHKSGGEFERSYLLREREGGVALGNITAVAEEKFKEYLLLQKWHIDSKFNQMENLNLLQHMLNKCKSR